MNYSKQNRLRAGVLAVFVLLAGVWGGCEKLKISDDLAGFDPEGDLAQFAVTFTGPGQASGERFLDAGEGKLYTLAAASEQPELIDFVMLWGTSSGMNFVSPIEISRLAGWGTGTTMNETFMVKNATNFVKLKPTDANLSIYDDIRRSDDVKIAYERALAKVKDEEGYILNQFGPSLSLRELRDGDLVFFRTSKDVYAAGKILSLTTGNSGRVDMAFKMDLRNKKTIAPVSADEKLDTYDVSVTRPGYLNGQRYLDVSTGTTYDVSSSTPFVNHAFHNQEHVDVVFLNSTSYSGFNLIAPTDAARLEGWSSGRDINTDWLTKNDGNFVKLDASPYADSVFLYSYTKSKLHDAYQDAVERAQQLNDPYDVDHHGPGKHISSLKAGDVIFFKSVSKNVLAMLKVTSYTSGGSGSLALSAKVDNTTKTDVRRHPMALKFGQLNVGGWSTLSPEGNTYHVDLATITRHDPASADANPGSIDMLNLWSGTGFVNFMAPTSGAVTSWGSSSRIVDWEIRNPGTFIHIESPTAEERATFEALTDRDRLVEAFHELEATIASRPGYDDVRHGPSIRVRYMAPGSIVYFKSEAPGRNLYAAIDVINVTPGSANGREFLELLIKSNLLSEQPAAK